MPASLPSEDVIRAWARLIRAHQVALEAVESDLKAAGFPALSWYDVLLELKRERAEGLRPMELEQRLLIPQHNLSRLIERMVKAGHVQRRPCPEDGRGQIVGMTRAGRDLLRRMWPVYGASIQRHVGQRLVEEANAAKLAELLGLVIGGPLAAPRNRRRPSGMKRS